MKKMHLFKIVPFCIAGLIGVAYLGLPKHLDKVLSIYRPKRHLGTSSITENSNIAPQAAWLLSYPCTGSEYLIDIIHFLTGKNTATNYGHYVEMPNGKHSRNAYESVPLFVERINGPFLFTHHLPLPVGPSYIPVLSHGGGTCINCYPGRYILTRDEFIAKALTGTRFTPSTYNDGDNGFGWNEEVHYYGGLIKKALHLIRDPFEVIESRFLYFSNAYAGEFDWTSLYNQNSEGFYTFCEDSRVKFADEEDKWYHDDIKNASYDVPCHHEFYKLIQWHNLVFETIDYMGLPSQRFYYEDFLSDYAAQSEALLNFYDLSPIHNIHDPTNHISPFSDNMVDLIKPEDKVKIKNFIEVMASDRTLAIMDRYLRNILDVQ